MSPQSKSRKKKQGKAPGRRPEQQSPYGALLESAAVLRSESWLLADACEMSSLQEAQLHRCHVMVASSGDDKVNLVVSLLAKTEFGVPRVVARVNHPNNEILFTEAWGVDVAVSTPRLLSALVEEAVTVGGEPREIAGATELDDCRIGFKIGLQRDRGHYHLLVEQHADPFEDSRMERLEEVSWLHRNRQLLEHAIVDQNRAKERRFGLQIGGKRAAGGNIGDWAIKGLGGHGFTM